jgi:hypothetical protein
MSSPINAATALARLRLLRDGGFWSPQIELDLDTAGYYSIISLPLGHAAAEKALQLAAQRGAMKALAGKLKPVRAARMRTAVGKLDRMLVVVESEELLPPSSKTLAAGRFHRLVVTTNLDKCSRASAFWDRCTSLSREIRPPWTNLSSWRSSTLALRRGDGSQNPSSRRADHP